MDKNWKLCSEIEYCKFKDDCKPQWRKYYLCYSEDCQEKGVCTFSEISDLLTIMLESNSFYDEKTGEVLKERSFNFYNGKTGYKIANKELPYKEGLLEFLTDKRLEGRL